MIEKYFNDLNRCHDVYLNFSLCHEPTKINPKKEIRQDYEKSYFYIKISIFTPPKHYY